MTDRTAGAVTGGLIAGVALSAVMLAGEMLTGRPSELIELERATAVTFGLEAPLDGTAATPAEQLITHGGHLALSALAGLAYSALVDEDDDGPSGESRSGRPSSSPLTGSLVLLWA